MNVYILSTKHNWEEATGYRDTGNRLGHLVALSKVINLGYTHDDINFKDVKKYKSIGSKEDSKTYGSISLLYSLGEQSGNRYNSTFQIFEDDWDYEVIFKWGSTTHQQAVPVVGATVESKNKVTKGKFNFASLSPILIFWVKNVDMQYAIVKGILYGVF